MRTELASVFNKVSGKNEELSAVAAEASYIGNKKLNIHPTDPVKKDDLEFTDPYEGYSLSFRSSYKRDGDKEFVRACWVRPKGFGGSDHIFDREGETPKEAIKSGKSLLLSLNVRLFSGPVSFESMVGHSAITPDKWKDKNRGQYITASVNSAKDIVRTLKRVRTLAEEADIGMQTMSTRIFASHRDTVIPFRNFFIGSRNKIAGLYNDMKHGKGGFYSEHKTRFIGFPRLFAFIPTKKTIEENAAKRFMGNHAKVETGKPCLTQLVFENEDDKRNTPEYQALRDGIVGGTQSAYVLASPSISLPVNDPNDWKHIRLNIKDIPAQTLTLDSEAKEKLLRYSQEEERKWGVTQENGEIIFPGNRPSEHYL